MDGTCIQAPEAPNGEHSAAFFTRTGPGTSPARLDVEDVSWGPPGLPPILKRASFSVGAGRILGIVGPNGAGKSSLLRLLYGFHRPTSGRILLDGNDIRRMPAGWLSREMAVVLQEQPAEFELTVEEIVRLGRLPHRRRRGSVTDRNDMVVGRVLERLGLLGVGKRLMGTLSGGERQRVAIARALAQEPRILVLDEPTNHLDIRHQLETLALLRELGLTVVCSLHDLNATIDFADLVLVLFGGEMLEFGIPSDVLTPETISVAFSVNATGGAPNGNGARHFQFRL